MRVLKCLLVLMAFVAGAAQAEKRVALVIGNSTYENASVLANPANDARAMADKLGRIGFDVMLREDLTGQDFRIALGEFTEKALSSDIALVFYAGHGIEMGGRNYLIPVDARMRSEATATFETVALDSMLTTVKQAGKLGLIMLDACRDNPFAAAMQRTDGTRSLRRGLAPVSIEGQSGLLVSFAAQAGATAADGDTMHSPYTAALLQVLDEPGLEVGRMFRKVRKLVREATNGQQVPIERMQLPDEAIYLVAAPAPGGGTPPPTNTDPDPVQPPMQEDPLLVFLDAVQSGSKEKLEDFVRRYPDHPKAADARKLLLDMADTEFWQYTVSQDTEDAYRTYLIAFPDGRYADEAKEKLAAYSQPDPTPVNPTPPTPAQPVPVGQCAPLNGDWAVTGVPSDDTLFVRAGPDGDARAVGELPFNAVGISNVNCRSGGWCSLSYGCIRGWSYGGKYMRRGGSAGTSAFQGYYSVVDVASHDTLNLRTGPGKSKYGYDYDVVAELPYNATGVYVTDCQVQGNYRYRWCVVSYQGVTGWAYGRHLQSGSGQRPSRTTRAIAAGASCNELWYERNSIFDRNGYCFKTDRGKNAFDNSDCFTSNPSLTNAERNRVSEIKRLESQMGC